LEPSPVLSALGFARNELSRLCLGVLRTEAGELLSTDDIAGRVITAKNFDAADAILRAAIREALQRQTPRASSVAFILQKRWRSQKRKPIVSVAPSRLDLVDIHVQPHAADIYDELSESED